MHNFFRSGRARIEILVLVLIVLTAIGILASALFSTRGHAERVQCGMHIKEMGAAVLAYHDKKKALPASCIAPGYATWAVLIAPYLLHEQGNKIKDWDLQKSCADQEAAIRTSLVQFYFCPARHRTGWLSADRDSPGALGDYACAPTSDNTKVPWTSPNADGALILGEVLEKHSNRIVNWQSRITISMLKRGQSYTILLGEKHVPVDGLGQARFGDGSIYDSNQPEYFARLVDVEHGLAQGPTAPYKSNFGSYHPGLCQFLMADGSLRPFDNDTDPRVLQKLISRGE